MGSLSWSHHLPRIGSSENTDAPTKRTRRIVCETVHAALRTRHERPRGLASRVWQGSRSMCTSEVDVYTVAHTMRSVHRVVSSPRSEATGCSGINCQRLDTPLMIYITHASARRVSRLSTLGECILFHPILDDAVAHVFHVVVASDQ